MKTKIRVIALVAVLVVVAICFILFMNNENINEINQNEVVQNNEEFDLNAVIQQEVHKSLVDGEEIYVNSGLSWDINIPEERLADAENIIKSVEGEDFSFEGLEERKIVNIKEFLNKDIKIVAYAVEKNGESVHRIWFFDASNGKQLYSTIVIPQEEQFYEFTKIVHNLDQAGF